MPFAATWGALQAKLAAGTTIPNWTAAKGVLGDSFTVTGVTTNHVEISTPRAHTIQVVPVAGF